jgi:hypothetical protein
MAEEREEEEITPVPQIHVHEASAEPAEPADDPLQDVDKSKGT